MIIHVYLLYDLRSQVSRCFHLGAALPDRPMKNRGAETSWRSTADVVERHGSGATADLLQPDGHHPESA